MSNYNLEITNPLEDYCKQARYMYKDQAKMIAHVKSVGSGMYNKSEIIAELKRIENESKAV